MRLAIVLVLGTILALLSACAAAPLIEGTPSPVPSPSATAARGTATVPTPVWTPTVQATPPAQAVRTVSGYVLAAADTTPEGLFDAPRRFVFQVKTDEGTMVNVAFTAYPPSPVGDRERAKITLSLHEGTVQVGHYLRARGTYDLESDTLRVADQGDYLATSAGK